MRQRQERGLTVATVATSGSYNDLTDKPTIPAAQANSDWNAVSGVAQILNKPTIPTLPPARSFASPSRSLVTSTSATGFQVSSTRDSLVCYEGTFQTTSTIGGPSAITIFLETADTNSTTPGDWTVVAQQTNSNTITLAIVLQQVDVEPWSISRAIPAGKFVRIRSGGVTGTAVATINSQQQEVLL